MFYLERTGVYLGVGVYVSFPGYFAFFVVNLQTTTERGRKR